MGKFRQHFRSQSLLTRTIILIVAAVVVSNVIGWAIFQKDRHESEWAVGIERLAERLTLPVIALAENPKFDRPDLNRSLGLRGQFVWMSKRVVEDDILPFPMGRALEEAVGKELAGTGVDNFSLGLVDDDDMEEVRGFEEHEDRMKHRRRSRIGREGEEWGRHWKKSKDFLVLSAKLDEKQWVNVAVPFKPINFGWAPRNPGGFFFPLIIIIVVTVWAMRRATRPLTTFAQAAERLGRDVNAPPLEVKGPKEVRKAATAFNEMQDRLRVFIKDRTQMLAAVSHDLRTPITRLRLRAEFMEDEVQREKMLSDLEEMEAMIAATLSFARDDAASETTKKLDIAALLSSLCSDMVDGGETATYEGPETLAFEGRPVSLKRAFANLLENAVKYGHEATVRLLTTDAKIFVTIEDKGPGIPADQLEKVFDAFYRVETSRSRETGGTGLGLSVVRSIIHAHGGEIKLSNRPEGGLKVVVSLPI